MGVTLDYATPAPKPRLSIFAVAILLICIPIGSVVSFAILKIVPPDSIEWLVAYLAGLAGFLGLAILSIFRIRRSNGALWGTRYAVAGIVILILWALIAFYPPPM
jgi:hypothetical protein